MLGIYIRTSREGDKDESPIEQQRKAGIRFAESRKFQYEVYEDKGKSGYKLNDDDQDPFKNRPGLVNLISDIKAKKIDMVWVWEHSRLSRNQYASAVIFNVFEKYNIKVFEKDREFNMKDPQSKMIRGILDVMSEYERQLIVGRITRGLHEKIDQGRRSHGKLYGYKQTGKDAKGYQILEPVESEIENIKHGYKRLLEGATLRQITLELYDRKSLDKAESLRISRKWHKILRHFEYTGNALNMEGLEILKKFDAFEIDNLSVLADSKYYTKSVPYPVKIITVEKWIRAAERLRINRQIRKEYRTKKASKDLATGIIKCGICGQKYYSYTHGNKKGGKEYDYVYYKHYAAMGKIECNQKKSFAVENINEIFKIFYFYFYLVFDNTPDLIKDSQRMIKVQQAKISERIRQYEKDEKQFVRQIEKFNLALDGTADTGEIRILARRINEAEENQKANYEKLSHAKIELEQLNEQYSGNEMTNAYYNVKDRINEFFKKMNIEERRDELTKVIKECKAFHQYLLIDTGQVVFLFDTSRKYTFDRTMLKNLDNDEVYKTYFIDGKDKEKVNRYNQYLIVNVNLTRHPKVLEFLNEYTLKILHFSYDLSGKTNLVSFAFLRTLFDIETMKIKEGMDKSVVLRRFSQKEP